jgi:hypothetical protein
MQGFGSQALGGEGPLMPFPNAAASRTAASRAPDVGSTPGKSLAMGATVCRSGHADGRTVPPGVRAPAMGGGLIDE